VTLSDYKITLGKGLKITLGKGLQGFLQGLEGLERVWEITLGKGLGLGLERVWEITLGKGLGFQGLGDHPRQGFGGDCRGRY
jgi:hypothetical protein